MSHSVVAPRHLGRTGIPVTALSIGASSLGAGTRVGDDGERDAVAVAAEILAGPFRLIDTSNEYAGGRSEAVLGLARARAAVDPAPRIVTKVDRDPASGRFDRDRVLRSVEESLGRLGVDRVPLLHFHDPHTVTLSEAMAPDGPVAALVELRDAGVAGAIGIAAGSVPVVRAYVATDAFDAVLNHNRYTLVDRSAEPLFADARARGMGVFNAAPFGAGILVTGARAGAGYGYRPASPALADWVARLEARCAHHRVPLAALALRFSTRSPLVDTTAVGVSSPGRIPGLVALESHDIPDELWHDLDDLGPAPTPISDTPLETHR